MANNRLYIVDTKTGERFLLAKSWGHGWNVYIPEDGHTALRMAELGEWLKGHDADACYGNTSDMKPTQLALITENEE